jgi:threonine/homoserine/homoserine lactone efflux protein
MPPLLPGLVFGFSIAAPVGPIGMLCLRRSLNHGRLAGLVSGLGAATADAIFGLIAALGLTAFTAVLVGWRPWLQLGAGSFLVCLGLETFRARPRPRPAPPAPGRGSPPPTAPRWCSP